jgi:hypothetical protein
MVMRQWLCVGDPPVTGGAVLPYVGRHFGIGDAGIPPALIGGQVYCEKCDSTGIIAKAGGPRRPNFISEIAIDGDICLCKCSPPPPIKATIALTVWEEDMAVGGGVTAPSYDEQIQFLDSSKNPVANTYYTLHMQDDSKITGVTDDKGKTERISTDKPLKVMGVEFHSHAESCCSGGE